jgi:hypothetical protein
MTHPASTCAHVARVSAARRRHGSSFIVLLVPGMP